MRFAFPFVLAVVTTGCFGTLRPTMDWRGMGEADPQRDASVERDFAGAVDLSLKTRDDPALQASAPPLTAKVMVDTVPEGFLLEKNVLSVREGFHHQILGKVQLRPDIGFFPGYEAGWKTPYCAPQRVLTVLTLGVWMLLPWSWPCNPTTSRSKQYWLDEAKRAAAVVGGDLVLGDYLGESEADAYGFEGFVVRTERSAPTPQAPVDQT